jgi:hypothetical protein
MRDWLDEGRKWTTPAPSGLESLPFILQDERAVFALLLF